MGIKSRLEQQLRRAVRFGDEEEAQELRELIADLQKARGDAAYQRAQAKNTYTVKPGDSPFSVAEEVLGDVGWFYELMEANPGVYTFRPGMEIYLPTAQGDPSPVSYEDYGQQVEGYESAIREPTETELPAWLRTELEEEPAQSGGRGQREAAGSGASGEVDTEDAQLDQLADEVVELMAKLGLVQTEPISAAGVRGENLLDADKQIDRGETERVKQEDEAVESGVAAEGTPTPPTPEPQPTPMPQPLPSPTEVKQSEDEDVAEKGESMFQPQATGTPDLREHELEVLPTQTPEFETPTPTPTEPISFGPERDYAFKPDETAPEGFLVGYTVDDFASMTVEERMNWIWVMSNQYASHSEGGGWFNNIWSIVALFGDSQVFMGFQDPDNAASEWISVSDAVVFEEIQNGWLLANEFELPMIEDEQRDLVLKIQRQDGTFVEVDYMEERERVASLWEDFFDLLQEESEDLRSKDEALLKLWGQAELASTQLGEAYASNLVGSIPEEQAEAVEYFVEVGDIYRTVLREGVVEEFYEAAFPKIVEVYAQETIKVAQEEGVLNPSPSLAQSGGEAANFMTKGLLLPVVSLAVPDMDQWFFGPNTTIDELDPALVRLFDLKKSDFYGPTYLSGFLLENMYLNLETRPIAEEILQNLKEALEQALQTQE